MSAKNFYCISSRIEKTGQFYGCFKIGPFSGHQSWTFANTLRRTLLADTSKCVFDALQIFGVEHEYSCLKGVRESVIDIILNLEKCIFQMTEPITKPRIAFLNCCGPGIVRAQHLHLPHGLQCMNPSQYVATLEVDGRCTLKLFFAPHWNKFLPFVQHLHTKDQGNLQKEKSFNELSPRFLQTQLNIDRVPTVFSLKWNQKFSTWSFVSRSKNQKLNSLEVNRFRSIQKKHSMNDFQTFVNHFKPSNFKDQDLVQKRLKKSKLSLGQLQKKKFKCILNSNQASIFQKQTSENFLFLQNSRCSIERVNYTLQSQISGFSSALFPKYSQTQFESSPFSVPSTRTGVDAAFSVKSPIIYEEEFIFFEVWTDGSCHPQVLLFKAMNEILLDFFSYRLEMQPLAVQNFRSQHSTDQFSPTFLVEKTFHEKFLNLEISNFYFNLETYIFLKKKSIDRVIDFLNYFQKNSIPQQSTIQNAVQKFQKFLLDQLQKKNSKDF